MTNDPLYNITTEDGKYTFQLTQTGGLRCLRYGEPWCECLKPEKAIIALLDEVERARQRISARNRPCSLHAPYIVDCCLDCQSWLQCDDVKLLEPIEPPPLTAAQPPSFEPIDYAG